MRICWHKLGSQCLGQALLNGLDWGAISNGPHAVLWLAFCAPNAWVGALCACWGASFVLFPDELIRQVTIESPERGLLLLRVRDEIRMTLDAYKTLYDSR